MSDFEFNIIDNYSECEDDKVVLILNLSNKYYDVQIWYLDDYFKDKQANKIQKQWINVVCTPKKCLIDLFYVNSEVLVKLDYYSFSSELNQIDRVKRNLSKISEHLDIAQQSGVELQKILNEYFLKYAEE